MIRSDRPERYVVSVHGFVFRKGQTGNMQACAVRYAGLLERVVASCEYGVGHDRLHVPTSDVAACHSLNISRAMTQFLDCQWNLCVHVEFGVVEQTKVSYKFFSISNEVSGLCKSAKRNI
jgi:hypothetical protein